MEVFRHEVVHVSVERDTHLCFLVVLSSAMNAFANQFAHWMKFSYDRSRSPHNTPVFILRPLNSSLKLVFIVGKFAVSLAWYPVNSPFKYVNRFWINAIEFYVLAMVHIGTIQGGENMNKQSTVSNSVKYMWPTKLVRPFTRSLSVQFTNNDIDYWINTFEFYVLAMVHTGSIQGEVNINK